MNDRLTVADLKRFIADVPDDVIVIVRTDYYYEYADEPYYDEDFIKDYVRNTRFPALVIEG
jgi:hypothetical protein